MIVITDTGQGKGSLLNGQKARTKKIDKHLGEAFWGGKKDLGLCAENSRYPKVRKPIQELFLMGSQDGITGS